MGEQKDMFWGLVVKAGKRYETEVQSPFRLTKACLEPSTAGSKVSSVMVENSDGENYILANLNQRTFNENLDIAFNEGENICFKVEGAGTVHLTGNLVPEQDEGFPGMFDEDDSDDEDIAELEDIAKQAQKIKKGIRALPPGGVEEESDSDEESDEESEDGEEEKEVVKRKLEDSIEVPAKKAKKDITEEESEDDSDEEDSDGDDDSEDEGDEDDDELDSIGDLTEEQAKKLELIRKMYETAEGKVNTEVNNAKKKNKPVEDSKKKPVEDSKKKPVADSKKKPEEAKKPEKGALTGKDVKEQAVKAAKAEVPAVRTLKGGVQIEDQCLGSGAEARKGNFVGMYYKGWLRGDKKTFDSCMSGKPFRFRLGSGQVIAGWERGVLGMKEGGKRRLTLAPNMGYGTRGAPPDIPGNATLVFDIECKYVKLHASQEKL